MTRMDAVPQDVAARAVHEQFLSLVCEDEELLAAEFDEIVAHAWDGPHPPSPGQPAGPAAEGWDTHRPQGPRRRLPARPGHPGADAWARERGPPPGRADDPEDDGGDADT
jgi:hypothetical protein